MIPFDSRSSKSAFRTGKGYNVRKAMGIVFFETRTETVYILYNNKSIFELGIAEFDRRNSCGSQPEYHRRPRKPSLALCGRSISTLFREFSWMCTVFKIVRQRSIEIESLIVAINWRTIPNDATFVPFSRRCITIFATFSCFAWL